MLCQHVQTMAWTCPACQYEWQEHGVEFERTMPSGEVWKL